jgi:GNAT superfamily N-acetyltransferase
VPRKSVLAWQPATSVRWKDLETLFGERGACGGCWCMTWRLPRSVFDAQKGEGNKSALRRIVRSGREPGILLYDGDSAIGWCAVAPREEYPALTRSRVLKRLDDARVWSVSCLFVAKPYRRRGMSEVLVRGAVEFAGDRGATIVEGYPIEPSGTLPDPDVNLQIPDIRLSTITLVRIAPTNSAAFVDGLWTGTFTVDASATNLTIRATGPLGHTGASAPFAVSKWIFIYACIVLLILRWLILLI